MQITDSNLKYLFNTFDLRFQDAYRNSPEPFWNQLATEIPSSSEFQTYGWAARVPQLREWVGDRQLANIATYSRQVVNKHFERTIALSADKVRDDQFDIFGFDVQDLARAAKKWPDTMLFGSTGPLRNGQNIAIWDGTNFFSTTHPTGYYAGQVAAANQSNYTSSGGGLTADNYQSARAAMMAYNGEDGLPLGVVPDTLVVPPQLEVTARLICEATSIAPQTLGAVSQVGANTNVLAGTAKVVVVPDLSADSTTWYLLDTGARGGIGGSIKPFLFQNRQAPQQLQLTNPTDYPVWMRNQFQFGVDVRGNVDCTLWFLAYKSVA